MQTQLPPSVLATASGRRADAILRACVHCGFCNATCPTYLLTGDELDGPRGRIYLVKEMLEADAPSSVAREHLDRCLTCRACETTCPSGVAYGELAEIGRDFIEARDRRGMGDRLMRDALVRVRVVTRATRVFCAARTRVSLDAARISRARGAAYRGSAPSRDEKSRASRRRARRLCATRHDARGQRGARAHPGCRRHQSGPRRR